MKTTFQFQRKHFIGLMLFFLVAILTFATASSINNNLDVDSVIGTSNLGASGSGFLLYQIKEDGTMEDGDLKLVVGLEGDAANVVMVSPVGTEEKQEVPEPEDGTGTLGQSEPQKPNEGEELLDTAPRPASAPNTAVTEEEKENTAKKKKLIATLGLSVNGVTEVEEDIKLDTELAFEATVAGLYHFEFYSSENELIHRAPYLLDVINPGDISIAPLAGEQFNINRPVKMQLSYIPIDNGEEKYIKIILPPYMTVSGIPAVGPEISYTQSKMDLPENYYKPLTNSTILTNYVKDAANSAYTKCDVLTIKLSKEVTTKFDLTFTISFNSLVTFQTSLGKLMVEYGTDPDKIPLLTIAEALNKNQTLINKDTFLGTSVLTNVDGSPANNMYTPRAKNPNPTWSIIAYELNKPRISRYSTLVLGDLLVNHYPISNFNAYFPHNPKLTYPASTVIKNISGKDYVVSPVPLQKDNPAINPFVAGYFPVSNDIWSLPHINTLLPGDVFELGEVLHGYTYKGEEYIHNNINLQNITVPQYSDPVYAFRYLAPNGTFIMAEAEKDRLQGRTDDQYRLDLQSGIRGGVNSSSTTKVLSAVFENATVVLDFPYEISPYKIDFTTGTSDLSGILNMFPSKVTYTTHTGSTDTIPISSPTTSIALPTDQGHITQVVFHYDIFQSNMFVTYTATAVNETKDASGSSLPAVFPTNITAKLTTPDNNKTGGYGLPLSDQVKEPIVHKNNVCPVNLVGVSDGLRFGTYNSQVYATTYPQGYSAVTLHSGTQLIARDKGKTGISATNPKRFAPWCMTFFTTNNVNIDYENFRIQFAGTTLEEKKVLSRISGIEISDITPGVQAEKLEAFYTTNKDPGGRIEQIINSNPKSFAFNLATDEYITYIELRFGTIYGAYLHNRPEKFVDKDEVIYISNQSSAKRAPRITPYYNGNHYYFNGTPEQEKVVSGKELTLTATAVSDTYVQSFDPASTAPFKNSTSTGYFSMFLHKDLTLSRSQHYTQTSAWSKPGKGYYQNTYPSFKLGTAPVGITYRDEIGLSFLTTATFPDMRHLLYLEANADFEIIGVTGHNLVSSTPLIAPNATKTTLYVFESFNTVVPADVTVNAYVKPNATLANSTPILRNAGISYQNFYDQYMNNLTGDQAYYNNAPYYKLTVTGEDFPSYWGIPSSELQQAMPISQLPNGQTSISVDRAVADKIIINPVVNGVLGSDFKEHQKTTLSATAWMVSLSNSPTYQYKARFDLPRKGGTTQGSTVNSTIQYHSNNYDMFLTGHPSSPDNLDTPVYTFYDDGGNVIPGLNPSSPASDFRSVAAFELVYNNMEPYASYQLNMPLETNYQKVGTELVPINAYVGAAATKRLASGDSFGAFVYNDPAAFNFNSYLLNMRIGLDNQENGNLAVLSPVGKVNVYYNDSGTEKLLYTNNLKDTHAIEVNSDVTRVEVLPNNSALHKLTKETFFANSAADSDIPRASGSKNVVLADLINENPNQYDAAFIVLPDVQVNNMTVMVGATKGSDAVSKLVNGGNPSILHSLTFDNSGTNAAVATLNPATKNVTGVAKGTTTYDVTSTNSFGDSATKTVTITVLPKLVKTGSVAKKLATGSRDLATGSFEFSLWAEGETPASLTGIAINGSKPVAFLERGIKHYIKEVNLPTGYILNRFEVTTNSMATPAAAVTLEGANYTFTVPTDATVVTITAFNDNDKHNMTVEKLFEAGSIELNPAQAYPVSITEQGTGTSVAALNLKTDGVTGAASGMVVGMTYHIKEVAPINTELASIAVLDSVGTPTAVQPIKVDSTTYSLAMAAEHAGGKIVVTNRASFFKGLTLSKTIVPANLPQETFEFDLVGDNGFTAYGSVQSVASPGSATVTWYTNDTKASPLSVAKLPTGIYTLTERTGTATSNFKLSDFSFTSASTPAPGSTATALKFQVTATSPDHAVTATNTPKAEGSLTVIKSADLGGFVNDNIVFALTHKPSGAVYLSDNMLTGDGQLFDSWTAVSGGAVHTNNLPLGEYSLTEVNSGEHFDFVGFVDDGSGDFTLSVDRKTAAFTLSNAGKNSLTITAFNQLKTGMLTITKTLSDGFIDPATVSETFTFDLYKYVDGISDAYIGSYPVTVAKTDPGLTKTIHMQGMSYGKYYVVEQASSDYTLASASSNVLAHDGTLNPATNVLTLDRNDAEFTAINRRQNSAAGLTVMKSALDAGEVATPNVFDFTIEDRNNTIIYSGKINSSAAGVNTAVGGAVTWTRVGAHTNGYFATPGDTSGVTIQGLEYGVYVVKEIGTGAEFRPVSVSANPALGLPVGKDTFNLMVNSATQGIANTITFTNERSFVNAATIVKGFDTGSSNIRTQTFNFDYWETALGAGSKVSVTGVDENTSKPLTLKKGVTYSMTEVGVPAGYEFSGVAVTSNSTGTPAITVTKNGANYEFTVPNDATAVSVTGNNKNVTSTYKLEKAFAAGSPNLHPNQAYAITISETSGGLTAFSTNTLKNGSANAENATGLVEGVSYTITETVPTDYFLVNMQILNAGGTPIGTQPVRVSNSSYSVTLTAAHAGGHIVVTNKMLTGNGLDLKKLVEPNSLAKEEFTFTLDGPSGYKAYGQVKNNVAAYPANVAWFSDAGYTTPTSVAVLPIGSYTLKENDNNVDFKFDKFVTASPVTSNTGNSLVFNVTDSGSPLVTVEAQNIPKAGGGLTVTKTLDTTNFKDASITFMLTHKLSGATYTSTAVVTANGQTFTAWKATNGGVVHTGNLPFGEYTLTETDSGAYYDFDGFVDDGSGKYTLSGDKKTATFTLSAKAGASSTIAIEAKNVLKTGELSITKQITGNFSDNAAETFNFEIWKYVPGATDIKHSNQSITVSKTDPGYTKTLTLTGIPYGQYYVQETAHTDFELVPTTSTVISPATSPVGKTITLTGAGARFTAINKLQNSPVGLTVAKVALDAGEVATPNNFTFSLKKGAVELYSGSVASNASGVNTATGGLVTWTKSGVHNNGTVDISGTAINDMEFGGYTIEEITTGPDFRPVIVTGTNGVAISNRTFSLVIDSSSVTLGNTVKFVNERSFAKTATIVKGFDTGSSNIRTQTFNFDYWETALGTGSKVSVTGVDENTTKSLTFKKGVNYTLTEVNVPAGYEFSGVAVTSNSTGTPAITVTKNGANYEFTVPNDATAVSVTGNNKNVTSTNALRKVFAAGSPNLHPAHNYEVTITETGNIVPTFTTNTLVSGGSVNTTGIVSGVEYTLKETVPTDYALVSVKIVNPLTGADLGTQPVKATDNSYKFTLSAAQMDGVFVVTNRMRTGNGLALTKLIENNLLPKEKYTFSLQGPYGYTAYGLVDSTVSSYPANVAWFSNATHTTPTTVANLPIGDYTLKETSTNTNFEFSKFIAANPAVTSNVGNALKFKVTDGGTANTLITASVTNVPRSAGSVAVTKTFDPSLFDGDQFTFTLTHTSGAVFTSTQTVQVGSTGTLTFTGWKKTGDLSGHVFTGDLPLGQYSLTETLAGTHYSFKGFVNDGSGNYTLSPDAKTATFTLSKTAGAIDALAITGENTLATASLKITKNLIGGLAGSPSATFKFNVYLINTNGTTTHIDANGADPGNAAALVYNAADLPGAVTISVDNLVYGKYYVLEEPHPMYTLQPTSAVGTTSGNATIQTMAGDITFIANNKLNAAPQSLLVYKTAEKSSGFTPNDFTFKLTDSTNTMLYTGLVKSDASDIATGSKVVWTKVGAHTNGTLQVGNTEIKDLIYGSYNIRETISGGDYTFVGVAGRYGLGSVSGNGLAFTLNNATDSLPELGIDFTNRLKAEGSLVVNKVFTANENPFPGTVFTFELTHIASGVKYHGTTDGTTPVSSWQKVADGMVTPNGKLPFGSYEVTELADANYNFVGFTTIAPPAAGTITPAKATATISSANKVVTLTAENKIKATATLDLNKVFENGYNHRDDATFTFKLFGPATNGTMPTAPRATITADKASGWQSATLANLPFGNYELIEDLTGLTDYEFVSIGTGTNLVTSTDGTPVKLAFTFGAKAGQTATANVVATNRVASIGSLNITKKMDGIHGLMENGFTFKIDGPNGTTQNVTVKPTETLTVNNLLLGNYTVTEIEDPDYTLLGYGTNLATLSPTPPTFRLDIASLSASVTAFNSAKTDGTLTISPDMVLAEKPNIANIKDLEFTFQLQLSLDGGKTWAAPRSNAGEVTLKINETHTYTKLVRGVHYKVVSTLPKNSIYMLSEILSAGDAEAAVKEKTLIFTPSHKNLHEKSEFLYDVKNMDLVLYKHDDTYYSLPLEKAYFILSKKDSKGEFQILPPGRWTDSSGNAIFKRLKVGDYLLLEDRAPKDYRIGQRNTTFKIYNDDTTGELIVEIVGYNKAGSVNGHIISLSNTFISKTYGGNKGPSKGPDGDSGFKTPTETKVLGYLLESPPTNSHIPVSILPNAGGFPVVSVAFLGLVSVITGVFVKAKEKKKNEEK